jgi:hypothetical protein
MKGRAVFATLTGGLLILLLAIAVLASDPPVASEPVPAPWIGEALWSSRGLDLTIQAFILLAGVLAILLLLRVEPGGGPHG